MKHFANKFWTHPNAFVTYMWMRCCPPVFVALKGLKVAPTVTKLQLNDASKKRTTSRKGGEKRNASSDSLASGFTIIQQRCNNQSDCATKEIKHSIPQWKSIPLLHRTGDGALQPWCRPTAGGDDTTWWEHTLARKSNVEIASGNSFISRSGRLLSKKSKRMQVTACHTPPGHI